MTGRRTALRTIALLSLFAAASVAQQDLELVGVLADGSSEGDQLAASYPALAAQARTFPSEQVGYKVAVVADGYVEGQRPLFDMAFDRLVRAVGSASVVRENQAGWLFVLYPVFVTSWHEGASHAGQGLWRSTAFGSTYVEATPSDTTIKADFARAWTWARSATWIEPDHVIVLVNDRQYAGTWWSNGTTVIPDFAGGGFAGTRFEDLVQHEFVGHGFGGLADEYVHPGGQRRPWRGAPNCDTRPNAPRWRDLIGWHLEGWNYVFVGAYRGCVSADAYRPTWLSCGMNSVMSLPFCPVCRRWIQALIDHYRTRAL